MAVVDMSKPLNDAKTLISKSQAVRLFDVSALGPAMIIAGLKGKIGPVSRLFFVVSGVLTISYNWQNYVAYKKELEQKFKEG